MGLGHPIIEGGRTYSRRSRPDAGGGDVCRVAVAHMLVKLLSRHEGVGLGLAASDQMVDLTVTCYLITMGLASMVWGSFSEWFGRRKLLLVAGCIVVLASLGCGLVQSIWQLIGLRVMQAVGTSAATVLGYGVISDIYPREERGSAVGLYSMGPLLGQLVGPILGGVLSHYSEWRLIFFALSGLGAVSVAAIAAYLPETVVTLKPPPLKKSTKFPFVVCSGEIPNPFKCLEYLLYAKVLLATIYTCVLFATFYYLTLAQSNTFKFYRLDSLQLGLTYIPLGLADLIGSLVGGRLSDLSLRVFRSRYTTCPSEARLLLLPVGVVLITSGLTTLSFLLASDLELLMILGILMLTCISISITFVLLSCYVMDLFPKHAASTSAAGNLLRILLASVISTTNSTISYTFKVSTIFQALAVAQVVGVATFAILLAFRNKFMQEFPTSPTLK
ncbi:Dityrosine transporter 1 [Massospora cicadina]|nr:Dityrosine transporter 1 [Massospora cicadina]